MQPAPIKSDKNMELNKWKKDIIRYSPSQQKWIQPPKFLKMKLTFKKTDLNSDLNSDDENIYWTQCLLSISSEEKENIETILEQCKVTEIQALRALRQTNNDVVNAIMTFY